MMRGDTLWALLPVPALLIDARRTITRVNNAAEIFLSMSEAQLSGRSVDEVFDAASRIGSLIDRAREGFSVTSDHNVDFLWPEREPEPVDLIAARSEDPDEVLLLIQRRGRARRIDSSFTHRQAARSLTGMAAMLAHEIRNPLAGISGAAQLLEMNAQEEDLPLTSLIRDETDRISKMIDRVQSFGDRASLKLAPVNIHDVLDRAKRSAEAGFARHIRFQTEFDPSLPEVHGDHDQLVQLMLNLLKNAAEAAPASGGVVALKTAFESGVAMTTPGGARVGLPLLVEIADNGQGVSPDLLKEIFDPFVTSKSGGSGLGLALASKIVADHGGTIDCLMRPGWTIFRLRFPIWRGPQGE